MRICKKITAILIITFLLIYFTPKEILAATSNNGLASDELLKFNNYTIKENTTISEINSKFGSPKVEGDSAFGGKSYSYSDSNLTWYLHIETNSNGDMMDMFII